MARTARFLARIHHVRWIGLALTRLGPCTTEGTREEKLGQRRSACVYYISDGSNMLAGPYNLGNPYGHRRMLGFERLQLARAPRAA